MHKIDGAGHLGHMFVMEDALINRPPTEITADFMNALQMELSNVIEWAGLALSKADNSQLLQALQAKFASINPAGDYATKTAVQFDDYKIADASVVGSANAIVAGFFPAITDLAASHGMVLYVRCLAANTTTTPTFTPNNGTIAAKTIVKGNNLPIAVGDIAGAGYWASLQYDLTLDKWVLNNPAKGVIVVPKRPAGEVIAFAGGGAPVGDYLQLATVVMNVSRSTYADLFAAIGTVWGAGDGASTFGLPFFEDGLAAIAVGAGVVGALSVGQVISHAHLMFNRLTFAGQGLTHDGSDEGDAGVSTVLGTATSYTGGSYNLAAGRRVKFYVSF